MIFIQKQGKVNSGGGVRVGDILRDNYRGGGLGCHVLHRHLADHLVLANNN